mgnify:CR=1 FL=1
MRDDMATVTGMRPVAGTDPTAGHRNVAITLERDGYMDIDVAMMFDGKAETLDPTTAIEFTTHDEPDKMHEFRIGDIIKMRVIINT